MKIVDRKTFLELPAGTLFAKYTPRYIEDVCIKRDGYSKLSFRYSPLFGQFEGDDCLEDFGLMEKSGVELDISCDVTFRDSSYEEDQLFAVFSKKDIKTLISNLEKLFNYKKRDGVYEVFC